MNPIKLLPLKGEVNILRLLARSGLTELKYPSDDILKTSLVDSALDVCHRLVHSEVSKEKSALCKNLNGKLGRFTYFGGDDINVVDVAAWSTLKQVYDNVGQDLSPNLTKWYQKVDRILF